MILINGLTHGTSVYAEKVNCMEAAKEIPWRKMKALGHMSADAVTVVMNSCMEKAILKICIDTKGDLEKMRTVNFAWVGRYCYEFVEPVSKNPKSRTDDGLIQAINELGGLEKLQNQAAKKADKLFPRFK
jgi:hypothetical protein